MDQLYLIQQLNETEIMTKQAKVTRLEKTGKKVIFLMSGQGLIVDGKKFESVNSAHKHFYGY